MKHNLPQLLALVASLRLILADISDPPPLHCVAASQVLTSQISCHVSKQSTHEIHVSLTRNSPGVLIDTNEHEPTSYFPWTHEPICYISPTNAVPKLCIFTNASYSDDRGISIFTTPSLAKEFSQLPAFSDPGALAKANSNHQAPSYVISTPKKGKAMFASRKLKRGELITAFTPLLVVYREDALSTKDREFYLRKGIEQLNKQSRERYEGMARIYGDERVKTQDVLKANTFGLHVGGMEHMAVWPEPARCNHACGPNAQYRTDPQTLVHYVTATRDIEEDEEITLTYINPFNSHADRQKQSTSAFRFNCDCPRCKKPSTSDQNINKIKKLEKLLADWNPKTNDKFATIRDAETLISLYKEEGLDGFLDIPYGHAALMYNAAGNEKGVKKYAKLAREAVGLKDGEGVGDWNFWRKMEVAPKKHWSWEKRKVRQPNA